MLHCNTMQHIIFYKDKRMKKRLIEETKKIVLAVSIGFLYYMWVISTNIYIPCIFNLITGLKCPGCGITHMIVNFCQLKFSEAFVANQFLFISLPIICVVYFSREMYYIRNGTRPKRGKILRTFEYAMCIALIGFGIMRNIPFN